MKFIFDLPYSICLYLTHPIFNMLKKIGVSKNDVAKLQPVLIVLKNLTKN